ncbi:NAD(+) diphosphatase [Croceicoccus gelatinilyticus]|uniref:NAD(+) diphosphatase n=1 Tax=Croceicoccus gelatinilyticus TaxID=2835536 RepID=UPI001BCAA20B|nr:NAD(+) diphosphatase [Croceicoccus gelatinilyticus]MBS7670553.1 NAD(+) diphosphatase [Croceicoccus gelatinilyticus]
MTLSQTGQPTALFELDRADHVRADPDALSELMGMRARLMKLHGLTPELDDSGCIKWGSLTDAEPDAELVFLGIDGDRGCFAAVPKRPVPMVRGEFMATITKLHDRQFGIYAGARSMVDWHSRHRFCAQCGSHTTLGKGGWQRNCVNEDCGASHFPRTDPVTIMTIERREDDGSRRLLLGRGLGWPGNMYSALAGFVEPGETIEEAVRREVMEEAGLPIAQVRYLSSQAWPMPSQLMIGCHCITFHEHIVVDRTELEDARWFSEEQVREVMSGRPGLFEAPPRYAIAHRLMRMWLEKV